MITPGDIAEVLSRSGLGHKTLAEHNVTCPPGFRVELDKDGNEVCKPDPFGVPLQTVPAPQVLIVDAGPPFPHRFPRHHHRHGPRPAGVKGLGAPSLVDIETFRGHARQARAYAAAGDLARARGSYDAAAQAFAALGSPPAYSDELDYAREAVYGNAAPQVRQQEEQRAGAAVNAAPDSIGFTDDPLAALYFRGIDPVRFGTAGIFSTEQAAAQARDLGLPGAEPQSGRDLSTKPPVPIGKKASSIAAGATLGGLAGLGLGLATSGVDKPTVTTTVAGSLLGALAGWAFGGER